jgi:hypothetical protein
MGMVLNEDLRCELLAMREEDLRVRAETIKDSSVDHGYHPRMEETHRRNAERLKAIIEQHGWPGRSLVGEDGMIAAWFIAQHAIGDPPFQRRVLELLKDAHRRCDVSPQAVAFLDDRIRMFEGRPQIHGTQFETDERGMYRPYQIEDPEHVNERRLAIGMNTIEERTRELNSDQHPEEISPEQRANRERSYLQWLRKVGWRT